MPSCAWGVHNQHPCWCHGRLNAFPDASGAGCFVAVESDARSNIQHPTIHRHTDSDARLWSRVSQPNSTIKKLPFQEAPTPTEKSDAISARNKDTGPNPIGEGSCHSPCTRFQGLRAVHTAMDTPLYRWAKILAGKAVAAR